MIIKSKNVSLKLDEILKAEISSFNFNETEKTVVKLVKKWVNGEKTFPFTTSGSTGAPKEVILSRNKIELSAKATFKHIDPEDQLKTVLLCLDPSFIGGAMVVFRALIKNLDLYIIEPTSHVMDDLPDNDSFDLVSMVPLQYKMLSSSDLNRFKIILIGGAPIEVSDYSSNCNVFSTYGMTETVSHLALRKLDQELFETVGGTLVRLDSKERLEFKGAITNNKWLKTNDVGTLYSDTTFKWIGRFDFIINSGGIKLNPESIEAKLAAEISSSFMITSLPDEKLGEKVVLIIEDSEHPDIDFSMLNKFEKPKTVMKGIAVSKTPSGKLDRLKTRITLIKTL